MNLPALSLYTPPPLLAVFEVIVPPSIVNVPALSTPPPLLAVFEVIVPPYIKNMPGFLTPPLLPEIVPLFMKNLPLL